MSKFRVLLGCEQLESRVTGKENQRARFLSIRTAFATECILEETKPTGRQATQNDTR
jgi:hypothetical protein